MQVAEIVIVVQFAEQPLGARRGTEQSQIPRALRQHLGE
jgi:hypothetical protein